MLEKADSFDSYTTAQLARRYGAPNVSSVSIVSPGINGSGSCLSCPAFNSDLVVNISSATEYFVGFDLNPSAGVTNNMFFRFLSVGGATSICDFTYVAGVLQTPFGNSSGPVFISGNWHTVQIHFKVSSTVGVVVVRVDGVTVLNATGINTGTTNIGALSLCSHAPTVLGLGSQINLFDNFWVFNTSGTHSNSFPLGRMVVQSTKPAVDGSNTSWVPNTGTTHFDRVNEVTADDDSTYVASIVPGDKDSYGIDPITGSISQVHGVVVSGVYRKDDVDPKTLRIFSKSGSATTETADLDALLTYTSSSLVLPEDPNTSAQWTQTDVDAIEIGFHLIS